MLYFSGFSLANENELFPFWLKNCKAFCVAGFSYGAIKALEFALQTKKRVDRVILLSPAFFNDVEQSLKKREINSFKRNQEAYLKQFFRNIKGKCNIDIYKYYNKGSLFELETLLYYEWKKEKILELINRGIEIEVILGGKDNIINLEGAINFFTNITTTYLVKKANHLLCEE